MTFLGASAGPDRAAVGVQIGSASILSLTSAVRDAARLMAQFDALTVRGELLGAERYQLVVGRDVPGEAVSELGQAGVDDSLAIGHSASFQPDDLTQRRLAVTVKRRRLEPGLRLTADGTGGTRVRCRLRQTRRGVTYVAMIRSSSAEMAF